MLSAGSVVTWVGTLVGLAAIVLVDLVVIGRRNRRVTVRDAALWVSVYICLAAVFGLVLFLLGSGHQGPEFFAGYVTEYSLSVDNLFVFVIIMARFAVPPESVDKVLYIGIVASMLLRAVCIFAGAAAIAAATWTFYIFGAFLLYTAVTVAVDSESDEGRYNESRLLRWLRRVLPITDVYIGRRLVVRANGRRHMTPLVMAIAAIGLANVMFALDSIPAIFGLTHDAYIVFTANAFALMGLRQLYFLVGGLLDRIIYLSLGLSIILGFIGLKLIIEALAGSGIDHVGAVALPHIGIDTSLAFIAGTLAVTVLVSAGKNRIARLRGGGPIDAVPGASVDREGEQLRDRT